MILFQQALALGRRELRVPHGAAALKQLRACAPVQARWQSNGGGSRESAEDKLDQLASFLEDQPTQERQPRGRFGYRGQGTAGGPSSSDREAKGPTKSFMNGQYYNPYTLSPSALREQPRRRSLPLLGPSKREAMKNDPIHILSLKPSKPSLADDSYKNGALLSEYISEMGKILPRNVTGLTRKSQRQIGKAIRRARALGILPYMSRGQGGKGSAGWR